MALTNSLSNFICLDDFEKLALQNLNKKISDYYKSGANDEETLHENKEAFRRLKFRARCLQDVSLRNLKTSVLGKTNSFPVGIAPSAMQKMAHPNGEIATAKGAASEDVIMILSTLSTTSIEEVAKAAPSANLWFQLYIYKDRNITQSLVKRAEKAGFSALVLTVDTPVFGNRLADSRNGFTLPSHLRLGNFEMNDIKSSLSSSTETSNLNKYVNSLFDPSISWKDVLWLKEITSLPIVVKGVLTAEDALLALQHGVSSIIVSNHGGRQLDGVPATIEALPEVVRAVNGRCEVYLDGGVRTGTDVIKALALGAKTVFIGRPILWGLACGGERGVRKVLQILRSEFDLGLALLGCTSVDDIKPSMVVRQEYYSKL